MSYIHAIQQVKRELIYIGHIVPEILLSCFRKFHVIYQARETVFHWDIQTPRRAKYDAHRSVFDKIRGVRIADETLS